MLHVADDNDTVTIYIAGRFDYRLMNDFQQLLVRSPRTWVVDLGGVDYVDSSALGMLLLLRERVHGEARRVHLRGAHGQPRDVLVMAGFDRMFELEAR